MKNRWGQDVDWYEVLDSYRQQSADGCITAALNEIDNLRKEIECDQRNFEDLYNRFYKAINVIDAARINCLTYDHSTNLANALRKWEED